MLRVVEYEKMTEADLESLVARNSDVNKEIEGQVIEILDQVKSEGDRALKKLAQKFDKDSPDELVLGEDVIALAAGKLDRMACRALEIAFSNIYSFHSVQTKKERKVETMPGVVCWREMRPIEKVGLYVPGGSAVLPSTLLMLSVPARIAGCKEIVVCTPPPAGGHLNPAIAYCLQLLQIDKIYLSGGAQAIAAMAFGTESIPKVNKIFGPGNQYVTMAKMLVQQLANVAIDMPAGPSEVLIIADDTANPSYAAADLLAQAEHGADSQAILVSTSEAFITAVNTELGKQIEQLPRAAIARKALQNSYAVLAKDLESCFAFSNSYAPEHLMIQLDDCQNHLRSIQNAGSVFMGHHAPESVGDYASGTNHTLPTGGFAKTHSGVSVDSFVKKITFQLLSEEGLERIGPVVETLAELEGLQGHKQAVSIRKK